MVIGKKSSILLVSTQESLAGQFRRLPDAAQYQIDMLNDIHQVIKYFETHSCDVLLISGETCRSLPEEYTDLLKIISGQSPATQIIFLVDKKDVKLAIRALEFGGYQYSKLPVADDELSLLIETALNQKPSVIADIKAETNKTVKFQQFVGYSEPMQKIYQQIRQAADTDITILLLGETGTGKDLAAQAIHRLSRRAGEPFIPVNLGALPPELVASELFGHEAGAFTGARKSRRGVFEQGKSGTVFLDEIDAVNEKVQISLLRLIEQKKFRRLGGDRYYSNKARIIAASNSDLTLLVEQRSFRQDLFYRLDVFRIEIPPVRERQDDIDLLIEHMLATYNKVFSKKIRGMDDECMRILRSYDWPGNIRELKNVIQRAVLVCEQAEITPAHLPARFQAVNADKMHISIPVGKQLNEIEQEVIRKTLQYTNSNRKLTAEILGISRRTLYDKLHKYKID